MCGVLVARKQPTGLTHRKGLGAQHRQRREQLLRALPDLSPCPICGLPMNKQTDRLDADHSRPRALYGTRHLPDRITHSRCNRAEGARLGNALRRVSEHIEPDLTGLAMQWP
jgi:5-methylcytosine-specific restriction endonuclease McrA